MKKGSGVFWVVLIIGFIGCDDGTSGNGEGSSNPFEGTWITGAYESTMVDNTWTIKQNGVNLAKGTFTYTNTVYTSTTTHYWDGSSWATDSTTGTVTMNYVINNSTMTISNHTGSDDFNGIWGKKIGGNVTTPFEGTWTIGNYENTMVGYTWITKENKLNYSKGTFTYTSTVWTSTLTHIWDGSSWIADTGVFTMDYVIHNNNTMTISNHTGGSQFEGLYTKQ